MAYGDDGSPGNVSSSVVVSVGGWGDFTEIVAGVDRSYAVEEQGQSLSYGDNGSPGNVSSPVVVGFGGWGDFTAIFAGEDGISAGREAV